MNKNICQTRTCVFTGALYSDRSLNTFFLKCLLPLEALFFPILLFIFFLQRNKRILAQYFPSRQ